MDYIRTLSGSTITTVPDETANEAVEEGHVIAVEPTAEQEVAVPIKEGEAVAADEEEGTVNGVEEEHKAGGMEVDDETLARAKRSGVLRHPDEAERNPCHCPDALFAIAWGICFLTTIFTSFEYGWTDVSEAEYDDDDDQHKKREAVGQLGKVLISQFLVALAIAEFVTLVSIRISRFAIHCSLVMTEIVLVLTAAFAAEYAYWYTAFFLVFLSFLVLLYHANTITTIHDASATLEVACNFIAEDPLLQLFHFIGAFVSSIMLFVGAFAAYALYHYKSSKPSEDRSALALAIFLLVIIFIWTSRVLKFVVVSVVAGTMRWWWAGEEPPLQAHPSVVALFRTWMFNLGSICFGAILVDIFDVCMQMLRRTREWADRYPDGLCASCLVAICGCTLGACSTGCDVVNSYALAFVGAHGYSFLYAGKQVIAVFHKMGRKANETEVFTDYIFFWQSVAIGLAIAVFGLYMVIHNNELRRGTNNAEVIVAFIGLFGGTAVASVVFALITGANKATALFFSDTPRVLAVSHPEAFGTLATVWQFGSAALGAGDYGTME